MVFFEFEKGLGFEDGLVFGEGMVGVEVQFVTAGFKVEVAKGDELVVGPLGEFDEQAAFATHFFEFLVGVFEKVGAHRFQIGVEDVVEAFGPAVAELVRTAEIKGFNQAVTGQKLVGRADKFGNVIRADKYGNHV